MDKFQVTRTNQTTPTLDLIARYDVTVDTSAKSATLRQFTVNGIQKGNALLKAELTSPMIVAWGNPTSAVGDSSLKFTISNFDFADWKPSIGELATCWVL